MINFKIAKSWSSLQKQNFLGTRFPNSTFFPSVQPFSFPSVHSFSIRLCRVEFGKVMIFESNDRIYLNFDVQFCSASHHFALLNKQYLGVCIEPWCSPVCPTLQFNTPQINWIGVAMVLLSRYCSKVCLIGIVDNIEYRPIRVHVAFIGVCLRFSTLLKHQR